jgi:hypothetical protein
MLFITSNLEKQPNPTDRFTTKLNAKFPWTPIMAKQRECCLCFGLYGKCHFDTCFFEKNFEGIVRNEIA